jgi:hypothetical protein
MSVQPVIGVGSIGTETGLASVIADLRRRLAQMESVRTSIGDAALTGTQIAAGSIYGTNIAAGSIIAGNIAAGAITSELIAAGAITTGLLAADSITADKIAANSIDADMIQAGVIQAVHMSAGSITTGAIVAGAITSDKISSGAVTSDKITVTSLSGITANLGNITAGNITGASFSTSSSGSRVVINSGGLTGYGIDGVTQIFRIDAGSGTAKFSGLIDAGSVVPTQYLSGSIGGYNLFSNTSFEVEPGTGWTSVPDPNPPISTWNSGGVSRDATVPGIPHGRYALTSSYDGTDGGTVHQFINDLELIPVVPGETYVLSVYVRASAGPFGAGIGVREYDNTFSYITQENGIEVNGFDNQANLPAGRWNRIASRWTCPTVSPPKYVGWVVTTDRSGRTSSAPDQMWIDGLQFERGNFPTAYSPKADEVLPDSIGAREIAAGSITANHIQAGSITATALSINFSGPNLLKNSGFEYGRYDAGIYSTSMSQWSTTFGTAIATTEDAWEGSRSAKLSRVGTGGNVAINNATGTVYNVYSGSDYVISGYFKGGTGTAGKRMYVTISYFSSDDTLLGDLVAEGTLTTGWQRVWVKGTAPVGAHHISVGAGADALDAGTSIYVDALQVEKSQMLSEYAPRWDDYIPGSIGPTVLTPNSITSDQIMANSILASSLFVTNLSAISADLGTITAGTINGTVITGATIRTAATGQRIEMDAASMRFYDSSGTRQLTASGSAIVSGTNFSGQRLQFDNFGLSGYNSVGSQLFGISTSGEMNLIKSGSAWGSINMREGSRSGNVIGTFQFAEYFGTQNTTTVRGYTSPGRNESKAELLAAPGNWTGSLTDHSTVSAYWNASTNNAIAGASAGNYSRVIIDNSERSGFVQNGSTSTSGTLGTLKMWTTGVATFNAGIPANSSGDVTYTMPGMNFPVSNSYIGYSTWVTDNVALMNSMISVGGDNLTVRYFNPVAAGTVPFSCAAVVFAAS